MLRFIFATIFVTFHLVNSVNCSEHNVTAAPVVHSGSNKTEKVTTDTPSEEISSEETEKAFTEEAADEGGCLKKWPKEVALNTDWFEKHMLRGFKVPMASKIFYIHVAKKLSRHHIKKEKQLNKMCLSITNSPSQVFLGLTDTQLPQNWEYFATDEQSGGLFYTLANQMSHYYFNKFFIVYKGYDRALVQSCKSNKKKKYVKECEPAEKVEKGHKKTKAKIVAKNNWMITKTDNKTYAVIVSCCPIKKRSWHVLSTGDTIRKSTEKHILDHIRKLGFSPSKAVVVSYKDKACRPKKHQDN